MNFAIFYFLNAKLAHTTMTNQRVKSIQQRSLTNSSTPEDSPLHKLFYQRREVNGALRDTDDTFTRVPERNF